MLDQLDTVIYEADLYRRNYLVEMIEYEGRVIYVVESGDKTTFLHASGRCFTSPEGGNDSD